MLRWLVVLSLLAVVVLVVGGQYAESRATDLVAEAVDSVAVSRGDVDVELAGRPLLYHLAVGRLPGIRIEVAPLEAGRPPVVFDRVEAQLDEVRYDVGDVLDGRPVTLDVGHGSVRAVIGEDELARVVARDRPDWDLRIEDGAIIAEGTVAGSDVRVTADAAIVDGGLALRTRRVETGALGPGAEAAVARAFDLTIRLPRLPGGLRPTDVSAEGDELVLTGRLRGPLEL